ncbi:phosphoribosylformylglycinamidine synthase, purS protein, partial [Escherichia coli]|nr:phosphoribosylformylglycinamidine synthase, purS protein [Escherichia coli]
SMGFNEVEAVRIGKVMELKLDTNDRAEAESRLKVMCEKLLANTVVEDYRYELEG